MADDLVTLHEPLTRRELEILFCLDERLSNQEIADRFILALSSVKWHIQQIFGKLDVKNRRQAVMRARELGLLKDKAGLRFLEHNIPALLTAFVGRVEELEAVIDLIRDPACRLLTLIGPVGIGKTRLAIQAAKEQIGNYRHGVLFVTSAAIHSIDYLVASIADAIPFSFHGPSSPQVQIHNFLREKELLLVLDNFEHLLVSKDEGRQNEGSKLLVDLLDAAPGLKILVTSRERLNIKGEWVYEVGGLDTPPLSEIGEEISLENYSATTLFLQSALHVQPGFLPIKVDKLEITKLCRLGKGMPLAIELAAGWVRLLGCVVLFWFSSGLLW